MLFEATLIAVLMAIPTIPLCFLERFLCRSEKQWPGRVLPLGWFCASLAVEAMTVAQTWKIYTADPRFIPQWILEMLFWLLLLNLPTLAFFLVRSSVREDMVRQAKEREELERMKRQDLE